MNAQTPQPPQSPETPGIGEDESAAHVASAVPLVSIATSGLMMRSVAKAALSAGEIASLFEVAGSEDKGVRQLDAGVAHLRKSQRAEARLRRSQSTKLCAALELRAATLRGATA